MSERSPQVPKPPESPCEGCSQPRDTENAQFVVSNVKALRRNRDQGCLTCPLVLQGLEKCLGYAAVAESKQLVLVFNGTGTRDFHIVVDNDYSRAVSFFVSPGVDETCAAVNCWPVGYQLPGSTVSTESLDWAKARLGECLASHPACASNQAATLPDRILNVGTSPDDIIRLQETAGELGRYICLSHCWGTQSFLCTLTSNLAFHKDSIPPQFLPRTFLDAVKLTRVLGLRYLWIDSLCIVQDDEDDWRVQSGKMADIYAGAHLTVAAAHAGNARGGLFSPPRLEMRAHKLSVPSRANDEDDLGIFARHALPHIDARYLGSLAAMPPPGGELPLLRRAWFFQEHFLSQRMLYFNTSELAWQCSSQTVCQCRGPQGDVPGILPMNVGLSITNPRRYYHTAALTAALQEKGKAEVARRWLSLVSDYSMLDMTFERDALPALSGLAKVFGRLLETPYKAGIWEGFITLGLLWNPADLTGAGRKRWGGRPREWRAPSWSWASAQTAVSFPSVGELLNPCNILSVYCPLRGSDATGEVVGGEMVVRGLLSEATVRRRDITGERHAWNVYVLDFMDGVMLGNSYADYDWTADGSGKVEDGAAVRCLLVGVQAERGVCYLLVLRKSSHTERISGGSLERIGLVEVFGNKVRRVSSDGTVRMVSPYEVIWRRSAEEIVMLV